jgi:hypothetical protein
MHRRRLAVLVFVGVFVVPAFALWWYSERAGQAISGRVADAAGPLADVQVRWQGEPTFVITDRDGRFRLPAPRGLSRHVTATAPGYRIGAVEPTTAPLELRLERLPVDDNEDYLWLSPHPDEREPARCGNCHDAIYREWTASAHARAARNPRVHQLIADPDGKSPPGWDLSREHPLGIGVCATCHAPTLEGDDDVRHASGVAADGVHCDYCHKIADAPTDKLGTRFGRDGLGLLRPPGGELLFYGPLPDAVRAGESFARLPLYKESRACASCHEGVLFGVHVYGTYSEWLDSPARAQGVQCQGCHMTPTGRLTNIAPGHGGIPRDPQTLASHGFPGGQADMLRRCLQLQVECRDLRVEVTVRADQVGHRVPTGFIDRHLLLVVQAFDGAGNPLPPASGPRLPTAAGRWSGVPGWLYGKLLRDPHGNAPMSFWRPGSELTDTRLHAGQPDRRSFTFAERPSRVEVRLWYRRFWQTVAEARGWQDNDVLVVETVAAP